MSKKRKNDTDENTTESGALQPADANKNLFYCGICAGVLAIVAFILAFFVLKVYGLIAAVVLVLASLAFFTSQKKKRNFKLNKIFTIIAYVLLGLFIAFFIGGIIYSSMQPAA